MALYHAVLLGVKYGYPVCCVAQFVNDHMNTETAPCALQRPGCEYCGFVACYECETSPCPVCGRTLTAWGEWAE